MPKKKNNVSRRDVLLAGGAAAVGLAVSPHLASGAFSERPAKKLRIGVVGGGFGTSFYWHEHPDCVVEAVSDLRADRREGLMRTYQCGQSYNSLEELVQ